jgi:hypothetical protein
MYFIRLTCDERTTAQRGAVNCRGAARASHKAHREGTCGLAARSRGRALQDLHLWHGPSSVLQLFAAAACASVNGLLPN